MLDMRVYIGAMHSDYSDTDDGQADGIAQDRDADAMLDREDFGDADPYYPRDEDFLSADEAAQNIIDAGGF